MEETFGSEVKRRLTSDYEVEPIASFVDWQKLQTADKEVTLTMLFRRDAASSVEYQALSPQEVAALLAKMIAITGRQKSEAIRSSVVEGIVNLINGIV